MGDRLADQVAGLVAGAPDPQNRDERCLSGRGVAADRLAGLRRRTLDIEEIVGDLEGKTEIMGVAAQRESRFRRRLAEDRAGLAGGCDERPGLEALQPRDGADVERRV